MCFLCTAGSDDIKLKKCTACHLVRYCSVKCQRDHWKQHKKECKMRAAELRDEILFKQPENNHYGDCPICCLPLPIELEKSGLYSCCSKRICCGCNHTNQMRETDERLHPKCPFCRTVMPDTQEEYNKRMVKRFESNDPVAVYSMGRKRYKEGDYETAFEYFTRSAALGDVEAQYQLSVLYHTGKGVEKDEKKVLYHTEQAAIGGHPFARHNLGCFEEKLGGRGRAAKHYIIASKLGFDDSLECVTKLYKDGVVTKDDFAAALRGHKAAIEATKSAQREEAYAYKLAERAN